MPRLVLASVAASLLAGCAETRSAAAPPNAGNPRSPATQPAPVVRAAPPVPEKVDPADIRALERSTRELLLKHLPDPIVVSSQAWGHQEAVTTGRLRRKPTTEMRKDGTWRRFTVRAPDPKSLALGITQAAYPEPGKATFTAMIGLNVDLKMEQQVWKNGTRLYSGETRGRCRAALLLRCEVTSRTEKTPGSVLPDVVFRVRATESQLFYENLVIEHTAGVGGDLARVLGDAVISTVKQAKPQLERDLLAKANAAIVKAADTKEVRVSFEGMLAGKVPGVVKPPVMVKPR